MANDKNKINDLVTDDDDPTAELEVLARTYDFIGEDDDRRDVSVSELETDLKNRSETIDRLQFDIEQLRAKWLGLEKEIKAREEISANLNSDLDSTKEKISRKDRLIRKRDQSIKALKAEIRARNDEYGERQQQITELEQRIEDLQKELSADRSEEAEQDRKLLEQQAGQLASDRTVIKDLQAQLVRTEEYADSLREALQERSTDSDAANETREFLQENLDRATDKMEGLEQELATELDTSVKLRKALDDIEQAHAEEIRVIRFELGEAQETVAQHGLVAEQLASDLVDTRGFRDELEQMLEKSETANRARIDELEKENARLQDELDDAVEKLESKGEAINCLLSELSKKSQQLESIGEIENVIHEIDDRMSERIEEHAGKERERITRLLIGSVDGQELRFPLFKDRLTIGRTDQNDIQLKASYVSRRHAVVVTDRDSTRVIDWGSKNGVFVNSHRVTEHFLHNGDIVTIGTADFRYEELPKRDS